MWSHSYGGNDLYLWHASNGLGLQQTFTWTYGRNNTHGSGAGAHADPYACAPVTYSGGVPTSNDPSTWSNAYPCDEADDQNWSRVLVAAGTSTVLQPMSTGAPQTTTELSNYTYFLTYPLVAQECSDCAAGMYWGNQNDGDYLDYYNGLFMGFAEADVTAPDNSLTKQLFYATQGYGLYDMSQVPCQSFTPPCHAAPWWNLTNAAHGRAYEVDHFDSDGTTLLSKEQYQYSATCPPSGVAGSGSTSFGNFDGNLVAELDHNNPVAACDVQLTRSDNFTYDGYGGSGSLPQATTTYSYDNYGRVTSATNISNDGGALGSPTSTTTTTDYIWNDAVQATSTSATGTYLIDFPTDTVTRVTGSATHSACAYFLYDGQSWAAGQQSGLTKGELTRLDHYISCGTDTTGASGFVSSTQTYDAWGNPVASDDADSLVGVSGHTGCVLSGGTTTYTTCTAYDTTFETLPITQTNALNQVATLAYANQGTAGGFGLWPTSVTDPNGQSTSYTYDHLGRQVSASAPGETAGYTTATSYNFWCPAPAGSGGTVGPQSPCVEIDQTQRLDSVTTVAKRSFYDGYGRLVETRTPAPGGNDVVTYTTYDTAGRPQYTSNPYFVAAYTGAPGASAYATPDATQARTVYSYPNLRTTSVTDPLSHTSTTTVSVACGQLGDSACYEVTTSVDPLSHQSAGFVDAWGRSIYAVRYTGNSTATYAVYATTKDIYDANGNLTQIVHPDGTTRSTFSYDAAGRQTGMTDPDRGTESYTYDANGNLTQFTDGRGSPAGTTYAGYDGLDRQIWHNTSNSASGAYVTYSYDGTASGNIGIGRLTGETFAGGPNHSLTGSYAYIYDVRGQQTHVTETVGGTAYPVATSYNDAGQVTSQTYPNNDVVSNTYTAQGWLAQVTRTTTGTTTSVLGGDTNVEATSDGVAPGNADAYQFTASSSGTANQLSLYLDATNTSTQVQVGLYSNDSSSGQNHPGTLLTSATITAPAAGAWNQMTLSGAALTAGQTYWIALMDPTGGGGLVDDITSNTSSSSTSESNSNVGSSLPTTWTTSAQWGALTLSAYVSQVGTGPSTTTLLGNVGYNGVGGPFGQVTSASLGGGTYAYAATYDQNLQLTDTTLTRTSDSTLLFEASRSYDPAGNVVHAWTRVPEGTDYQTFCYDEQNRLTWASSATGNIPCGGTWTAGSLTSAVYTQSFSYDTLDRLTSGPLGGYTYGNSAHVHAATQIGSGSTTYTAAYDAAGNMTCRAPNSASSCAGTHTGAQLSYDTEGQLSHWQSSPSGPSTTDDFLYDGEGNRVAQQSVSGASTTTTVYVGGLEEVATTGTATTTTVYYYAGGKRFALAVNGVLSYLASDNLGSADVTLAANGTPQADQLFTPYGSLRYATSTMPGSYGFTGQHSDAATTGLDYYGARYYDPLAGQFTSADSVLSGLNRYAYVGGNPETFIDPSGHELLQETQPGSELGRPPSGDSEIDGGGVSISFGGAAVIGALLTLNIGAAGLIIWGITHPPSATPVAPAGPYRTDAQMDHPILPSTDAQMGYPNPTGSPRQGSGGGSAGTGKGAGTGPKRAGAPIPQAGASGGAGSPPNTPPAASPAQPEDDRLARLQQLERQRAGMRPKPAAIARATTDGQDPILTTAGSPFVKVEGFDAFEYNDPDGSGACAELKACYEAMARGWHGSRITLEVSARGLPPCGSCMAMLQFWATQNGAGIDAYYLDGEGALQALPPIEP
jgi:RHS repeat-associated protein